jgi:formylglycine-generating enzyme required for sulfatase activity
LTINGVRYDLALIPAGEFQMGSNVGWGEQPVHTVRISKGFWLGKTEVTQGLWQAVMGSNPSHFNYGDNYPVERVSWDNCQAFITKLNQMVGGSFFRLPTEAEWEYACRAGTTGDRFGDLDAIAWFDGNSGLTTHPVGQKQPNAFGLYDTIGNVWEWCQDWYGESYTAGYQTDPTGAASGSWRVKRSGECEREARCARSPYRDADYPDYIISNNGFRLVAISASGG